MNARAQRPTTGEATVEFETDVLTVLADTVRGAVRLDASTAGTENLLSALVMGDAAAGEALAPGMRRAGAIGGLVSGRGGRGWVSDDAGTGADGGAPGASDDADAEVDMAWREACWRFVGSSRRETPEALPGMSGALRRCLRDALGLARAEGTVSARCRHVARALLGLPDSRAGEALVLQRTDRAAVRTALDALDTAEADGTAEAGLSPDVGRPESPTVAMLRRTGTLGKSGNFVSRRFSSWINGSPQYGSSMVGAVSLEALRQAVRSGRDRAEPVDLLLGVLGLDRALAVAGRSLPENLVAANSGAGLLSRHGVRPEAVARAAVEPAPAAPADDIRLSEAAERVRSVAQLRAAEQDSPTVGTRHLLAALLEAEDPAVTGLLAAGGVDTDALRAALAG